MNKTDTWRIKMYKKLLVPLDGSKRAETILPHAEAMAKGFGAQIIFLFVEEMPMMLETDEVVDEKKLMKSITDRRKEIQTYFEGILRKWRANDMNAEVRYSRGPVVKTIIEMAQREQADLVAMASHGRSGLGRAFYGSVAAGVLQQIDRPLLLIRSWSD